MGEDRPATDEEIALWQNMTNESTDFWKRKVVSLITRIRLEQDRVRQEQRRAKAAERVVDAARNVYVDFDECSGCVQVEVEAYEAAKAAGFKEE